MTNKNSFLGQLGDPGDSGNVPSQKTSARQGKRDMVRGVWESRPSGKQGQRCGNGADVQREAHSERDSSNRGSGFLAGKRHCRRVVGEG